MSSNRRKFRVNSVTVNIGCNCRRPRLTDIFRPKPKPKSKSKSKSDQQQQQQQQHKLMNVNTTYTNPTIYTNSSSSSWGKGTVYDDEEHTSNATFDTTTPCYSEHDSDTSSSKTVRVFGESLAVAKDSDDPYLDFRHSMLQMILEKEIYSRDDLRELLECFLSLNSPYHHEIIVRAFTEIWNGVFSVKPRVRRKAREFQVPHV